MVFIKSNPFLRILLPLIAGILIQFYFTFCTAVVFSGLFILLAIQILLSFVELSYQNRYWFGVGLNLTLLFFGMSLVVLKHQNNTNFNSSEKIQIYGQIVQTPAKTEKYYKSEIAVKAVNQKNKWHENNTKLLVYFEPHDSTPNLKAGQEIIFNAKINAIYELNNPFGFDYKQYMALKNIHQTAFVNKNDWQKCNDKTKGLKNIALNTRSKLIEIYKANGIKGNNLAILSALTLGYKNKLDERTRAAYSAAGAMHVLAVSGLHVAIIYGLLSISLFWLNGFKRLKKIKSIIILVAIWVYAFITGLSPSVMRASFMFSFILTGQLLNRNTRIYNSIAASAFMLLLINPLQIFEIGFQLSYAAVIGIIYFQPKLKALIYIPSKPLQWIWELTTVSIAAQLATFPITLYHFHQFPVYFWLSNIVVTSLAMILIPLAILLLLMSSIAIINNFIALLINSLLNFNLAFVTLIKEMPGSLIENIPINYAQSILLYLMLISLTIWIVKKHYNGIAFSLVFIILIGSIRFLQICKQQKQEFVCVYQTKGESAIQFIDQTNSTWLTSDELDNKKIKRLITDANFHWSTFDSKYFIFKNINDTVLVEKNWYYNKGYWKSQNKKGLIINEQTFFLKKPLDTLKLDYIFITGNTTFTLNQLSPKIVYTKIILDGSVPSWKQRKIRSLIDSKYVFLTKNNGSFISGSNL